MSILKCLSAFSSVSCWFMSFAYLSIRCFVLIVWIFKVKGTLSPQEMNCYIPVCHLSYDLLFGWASFLIWIFFIVVISYALDLYADVLRKWGKEVRNYFSCLHSLAAPLLGYISNQLLLTVHYSGSYVD